MLALFVKCYFSIMAPLLDDEIYYFTWSQKLDFGYPEHGPFLPWIYALISPLLGESAFAIRCFALFGMQIVSISVFFFMKNRFGNRTAWTSFLIYQLLPATFTLSIVSTIDTPMFIFGTYSLLFYCKGFFEDKKFFYVGGLFLGVSALSKVSAIWLGVGMFFYIIFSERRNDYFKNPHLWLSFFLAALIYSPFLLWNFVNDFPFFVNATNLLSRESSVKSFLVFWISQILLLFPSIFVLIFHALNSNLMKCSVELLFFGRETKPIHEAISSTIEPYIPNLTGNNDATIAILRSIGINYKNSGSQWKTLSDLSEEQNKELVELLIPYVSASENAEEVLGEIIGNIYTLNKEEEHSPLRDAREFAILIKTIKHKKMKKTAGLFITSIFISIAPS